MIGSIGVDFSGSRAAIGLLEWPDGQTRQGPVGDGRRLLVPVAATGSAWGSQAAEAVLAELPASARLDGSLYCWLRDPWSEEFLSGLRQRLLSFLGQPESAGFRTHQLFVCGDPQDTGGPAMVNDRLDAAGLPDAGLIPPADALLCRWLAETSAQPQGPVLAVACGESATDIGLYAVHAEEVLAIRMDGQRRVAAGSGAWMTELAGDVLRLCRPGVPASALLSLLDGADEFAALLRTGAHARNVDANLPMEWAGPMSQFMFEPLRVSRAELAKRKSVMDWTTPVASAVRGLLGAAAGRATLLVGGPGAAWPFVTGALTGLGAVWESGDPTLDLALGACWWQQFRPGFGRRPAAVHRTDPQPLASVPARYGTALAGTAPEDPTPWSTARQSAAAGSIVPEETGEMPWDHAPSGPPSVPSAPAADITAPAATTPVTTAAAGPSGEELAPWDM
jgi:hypothetical protein